MRLLNNWLIGIMLGFGETKDEVIQTITNIIGSNNMLSSNFVGPSIGAELTSDAIKAILIALIAGNERIISPILSNLAMHILFITLIQF